MMLFSKYATDNQGRKIYLPPHRPDDFFKNGETICYYVDAANGSDTLRFLDGLDREIVQATVIEDDFYDDRAIAIETANPVHSKTSFGGGKRIEAMKNNPYVFHDWELDYLKEHPAFFLRYLYAAFRECRWFTPRPLWQKVSGKKGGEVMKKVAILALIIVTGALFAIATPKEQTDNQPVASTEAPQFHDQVETGYRSNDRTVDDDFASGASYGAVDIEGDLAEFQENFPDRESNFDRESRHPVPRLNR